MRALVVAVFEQHLANAFYSPPVLDFVFYP